MTDKSSAQRYKKKSKVTKCLVKMLLLTYRLNIHFEPKDVICSRISDFGIDGKTAWHGGDSEANPVILVGLGSDTYV